MSQIWHEAAVGPADIIKRSCKLGTEGHPLCSCIYLAASCAALNHHAISKWSSPMLKHSAYILHAFMSQVWHQVTTISANSERSDLDEPQPDLAAGQPGVRHRPLPASPCVALSLDGFPSHGPDCPRR